MLDCGICGRDWIMETGADVIEVCELQYSKVTLPPRTYLAVALPVCHTIQPMTLNVHCACPLCCRASVCGVGSRQQLHGNVLPGHVHPGAVGAGGRTLRCGARRTWRAPSSPAS